MVGENQIIVAAAVTADTNDVHYLEPMFDTFENVNGMHPNKALVDAR